MMTLSLKQRRPPVPSWVVAEEVNCGSGYGEEGIACEGGVRFTLTFTNTPTFDELALSKVFLRYQGEKPHFAFLVSGGDGALDPQLVDDVAGLLKHCFRTVASLHNDEYVILATDGSGGLEVGDSIEVGEVNPPKSRAPA